MKEKFGQFAPQGHIECGDKDIRDKYWDEYANICRKWEKESLSVCEITGGEGSLRRKTYGWVKTLCDEKAKELGYEHTKQD